MKRLGVFVSILMLTVSLFGGFSRPNHVFAAFETAQSEILDAFRNDSKNYISKYNQAQATIFTQEYTELQKVLGDYSNSVSSSMDDSGFKAGALGKYQVYIESKSKNQDKEILQVYEDIRSTIIGLRYTDYAESGATAGLDGTGVVTTQPMAVENAKKAQVEPSPQVGTCTSFFNFSMGDCVTSFVTWLIKNTLLQIGGFLVWLTANMFNYSVQVGILNFKDWAPDALYPIWIMVRQIVSLLMIFAGLYLAFMYILGKEERFEKYIPWVVMFGIFVNFSYPLTRTLIDLSNIISLNIYASIVPGGLTATFTSPDTAGALIMSKLGLGGLIGEALSTKQSSGLLGEINNIPGSLMAVAFTFYTAYIFFMVTAIMVMRTLSLVFIIVVSPLLLVDSVLPMLGGKAKELRGIFFNQLIVGPVFMIMLALTLKFLDVFTTLKLSNISSLSTGSTGGTVVTFFNILMMLGMLHFSLKVTKEYSGKLGEMATNTLGTVSGVGLGMATGGLGFIGRQGVGRLATYSQNKGWVSRDPNSMSGRIANTLATSSFDLRNSSVVVGGTGKLGMNKGLLGFGGMGSGAASKNSFQAGSDAKVKKIETSAAARFKTRYERDVIDKDGNIIHRKGEIDEKQVAEREAFMKEKSGSLFLSKDAKQKLIDEETEEMSKNKVDTYNALKTKEEKKLELQKMEAELAEAKKTDPKFETAKSRALAKTVDTIKKKKKEDNEAFAKEFEKNLATYQAKEGKERAAYLAQQSKEMQESLLAGKNLRAEEEKKGGTQAATTASVAQTTEPKVADTDWSQYETPAIDRRGEEVPEVKQASPATSTPTPVMNSFAAKRAQGRDAARASMGEKKAEQSQEEKPGFLKSPEEKIRERAERQQEEKQSEDTANDMPFDKAA